VGSEVLLLELLPLFLCLLPRAWHVYYAAFCLLIGFDQLSDQCCKRGRHHTNQSSLHVFGSSAQQRISVSMLT
jgi:hypothetical protein